MVAWTLLTLLVAAVAASIIWDRIPGSDSPPSDSAQGTTGETPDASGDEFSDSAGYSADGPATTTAPEGPRSFTIAATGDLLIHGPVADAARSSDGWDFSAMFSSVAPIIRAADLAVCHVESPMSPNNARLSYYAAFVVPRELAEAISYAGYDTCSLASNHATDGGREGVVGTIGALDRAQVAHAGMAMSPENRDEVTLLEVGEATVAHLSYTYGFNNGELPEDKAYLSNVIDEAAILDEARRARSEGADFVVLSMHWGTSYRTPTSSKPTLGPACWPHPTST